MKFWRLRRLIARYSPEGHKSRRASARLKKRFYSNFWPNRAKELGFRIDYLGYGFYRLGNGRATTIVRDSLLRMDDFLVFKLSDNKTLVHKLLTEKKLPVPRWTTTKVVEISSMAKDIFGEGGLVVCKPAHGSRGGSGITTRLSNATELQHALKRTLTICETALVEEFVRGNSYRLLFLDGELLDAVDRKPPVVIGDGTNSIKQLIAMENGRRLESDPCIALSILTEDEEMKLTLNEQKLNKNVIPSRGEIVRLKTVVNQNNVDQNFRVYDDVHPSIVDICRKAVSALDVRLAGVDVIADDISKPADSQKPVINEVNCLPGLHHHYLVADNAQKICVASKIVGAILEKS